MRNKITEKMSIGKFFKSITPAMLKVIVTLMTLTASIAVSLTIYFTKNLNEISKQKIELLFEEKRKEITLKCNTDVNQLKNRCSMLENKLELLSSYIEFMKLDKTKPNYDKAIKIRDKYFSKAVK